MLIHGSSHLGILRRQRLHEEVYRRVREAILTGTLTPAERLHEQQLAQQLGVSRTPVRESLLKLEREGLIYRDHHSGFVVYPITKADVADAYACRGAIEGLIVAKAVERLSPTHLDALEAVVTQTQERLEAEDVRAVMRCNTEFHELLVEVAGSHIFRALNRHIWTYVERYRFAALALFAQSPAHLKRYLELLAQVLGDHREILAALRARDSHRARAVTERHAQTTGAGVMSCIATLDDALRLVNTSP
jgi:DNA-binding GntR family transcriptional regulator